MKFGIFKKRSKTIDFTKMPNARTFKRNIDLPISGDIVDLRKVQNDLQDHAIKSETSSVMDFLNSGSLSSSSSNVVTQISETSELKTKMRHFTGRIEDNANGIYRLMQRLELLEKKIERLEGR